MKLLTKRALVGLAAAGAVAGGITVAATQCGDTPPPPPPEPTTGFPTPATTGWQRTGVTLTPYTGPLTITTPGTVIDGKDVVGSLTISAPNVRITRSRVSGAGGDGGYVIFATGAETGLVIQDTEIRNIPGEVADRSFSFASSGGHETLTRVYGHGSQRGGEVGNFTTVHDSYFDDFVNLSDTHAAALMSIGGADNVTIRHNTLGCGAATNDGACSGALVAYPQIDFGGPHDNWIIDGNLLNGGAYCTYLGYTPPEQANTNMKVTNNGFGDKYHPDCGAYGPVSWDQATGNVWTGNYWYTPTQAKNGTAVNP